MNRGPHENCQESTKTGSAECLPVKDMCSRPMKCCSEWGMRQHFVQSGAMRKMVSQIVSRIFNVPWFCIHHHLRTKFCWCIWASNCWCRNLEHEFEQTKEAEQFLYWKATNCLVCVLDLPNMQSKCCSGLQQAITHVLFGCTLSQDMHEEFRQAKSNNLYFGATFNSDWQHRLEGKQNRQGNQKNNAQRLWNMATFSASRRSDFIMHKRADSRETSFR